MTRSLAAFLFSVVLVTPIVAHSETPSEAASKAFWRDGAKKYSLGKFEEAIQLFELAYEKHAYEDILYNLAQAHRQLKHHERAIFYYRSYLRAKPNAKNRDEVESFVEDLQRALREQEFARKRPPTAAKDPVGAMPVAQLTSHREPWYHDNWAWTAAGVGTALAGVGTWALLSARGLRADALDTDEATRMQLRARADDRDALGVPLLIGGGVAIGVGVALFAILPEASPAVPAVSMAPDGTTMVLWAGQF